MPTGLEMDAHRLEQEKTKALIRIANALEQMARDYHLKMQKEFPEEYDQ
jgi:hypothetical protein